MNMTNKNPFNMNTYSMHIKRVNIQHVIYPIRDRFIPKSISDYIQFIYSRSCHYFTTKGLFLSPLMVTNDVRLDFLATWHRRRKNVNDCSFPFREQLSFSVASNVIK